MSKKLQLKFFVLSSTLIVLIVYLYINRGFSFSINDDVQNFKGAVDVNKIKLVSPEIISKLREEITTIKEQSQNDKEDINSQITKRVLSKLASINYVTYEYEPWGIKFSYDPKMTKEINQDQQSIVLHYDQIKNVGVVITRHNLNGSFNDWLNNNYDLQNLDKENYNNLTFWAQNFNQKDNVVKEYYLHYNNNVFVIRLNSSLENKNNYWDVLQETIKSFNLIKNTNS